MEGHVYIPRAHFYCYLDDYCSLLGYSGGCEGMIRWTFILYEYCVNSLSQSFPYESLSVLVNNHFTQAAFDLVRALVPPHSPCQVNKK
jgi:hypothetical protein